MKKVSAPLSSWDTVHAQFPRGEVECPLQEAAKHDNPEGTVTVVVSATLAWEMWQAWHKHSDIRTI